MAAFRLSPPSSPEFFSRSQPPASRLSPQCKCAQYWPDQGCWTYGNIRVSVEDVTVLVDYTVRKFCIQQVLHPPPNPSPHPSSGPVPSAVSPHSIPASLSTQSHYKRAHLKRLGPLFPLKAGSSQVWRSALKSSSSRCPFRCLHRSQLCLTSRDETQRLARCFSSPFPSVTPSSHPPRLRLPSSLVVFPVLPEAGDKNERGGAWGMRESGWG